MIEAKAIGIASTTVAGLTTASLATPPPAPSPMMFNLLGVAVPVLPVLIGMLTAALVRVITITSSPGKLWSYNAAVTMLAMMGTATFITDHQTGPGMSFWVGTAFGAVGVGIVQIAKSKIFGAIVASLRIGIVKGIEDEQQGPTKPQP